MTQRISRRKFGQLLGMAAGAAALPATSVAAAVTEQSESSPSSAAARAFPQGFLWGSATASY